ncbi:hypothetical protein HPP92_012042 [Vanilla planifolia]|uniref:U3 small nucleolar RNA-associated protein 6 homolog n=1 Tax=Vanilla planifolia TaxID=51239 RepID=A0A835R5B8_VANPL|nr:hypothetical protein HPP92_012042 [Vanilla planifolia]
MADVVQFRLERMADELDDLEQRGLMDREKISEIIKQRREFEYRLQRRLPLKQDFLAYIEYEKQVEAYRKLRKKMILRQIESEEDKREAGKKRRRGKQWNKSLSDYAGILRILDLYRKALMKYKGDLGLWFQYLEFCRENKHGRMKEALGQALKLHPKVPGLWIYAAAWEFDQNLNVVAARALMQKGLRVCPDSEDLWIEYLRLELTYLNKLKARKMVLGENLKSLNTKNIKARQRKEENNDFMELITENNDEKQSETVNGTLEEQDRFWQFGSKVLEAIYHEAIKALPSSINLRKQFLEVLDCSCLAHSDELRMNILEDLKNDFSHDECYWDMMARLQISDVKTAIEEASQDVHAMLKRAFQVYEEAMNVLPSEKMFSLFVKFWLDLKDPDSIACRHGVEITDFSSSLIKAYEKAEASDCLIEDVACLYISFHLGAGQLQKARKLAEKLCNDKLSEATNLWLLRASIELNSLTDLTASTKKDDFHSIFQVLKNALSKLCISKAKPLWFMAMKLFSSDKVYFKKLVKILEGALVLHSGNHGSSISSAILDRVLQIDGMQHARNIYRRFIALPHPGLDFFKHCIELETNLASLGDDDALKNARWLYESALQNHCQNRELWKDYYGMEVKMGTSETANAVYWRARKELKDVIVM